MPGFLLGIKELDNGLRVMLLPRRETQTVTFLVLVGVGSRYEVPRQAGLSHFLEHMFFKGTAKRPDKREISEALDAVGAEFNAFTGEEVTGFYVKAAKEHLALAADVVADILQHSLFPSAEIEQERGVIKEEIRMYTDNPTHHVQHLWNKALFGEHPLGWRIDGTEETVAALQRRDFLSHTKKYYHAGNTVVAVAGNFEGKKTEKLLQEVIGDLPAGRVVKPRPAPADLPAARFVHERRAALDQTHLIMGVPGMDLNDDRRWAAELLAVTLGGGMSSRLFMEVREKYGLAYAVHTQAESLTDTGSIVTQAGLRSDKASFALQIILREHDRLQQELVKKTELDKAKEMVRGRLVLGLEETNAMAMFVASQSLLQEKVLTPDEVWERVRAVTAAEIREVAQVLLTPAKRAAALLGPQKSVVEFEKLIMAG